MHLNWHGARLEFLARFILALLQVRTVNLSRLAVVFSSRAKVSSNYIRLQRFLREFVIDQAEIALMVAALLPKDVPWILTLDRTNWKLGSVEINFLVLGVVYQGLAIPLFWTVPPKAGNSSTPERKALLERYWKTFCGQPVAYLLGDREFIGQEWLVYCAGANGRFGCGSNTITPSPRSAGNPTRCCANSAAWPSARPGCCASPGACGAWRSFSVPSASAKTGG